jgi:hypothetical protein
MAETLPVSKAVRKFTDQVNTNQRNGTAAKSGSGSFEYNLPKYFSDVSTDELSIGTPVQYDSKFGHYTNIRSKENGNRVQVKFPFLRAFEISSGQIVNKNGQWVHDPTKEYAPGTSFSFYFSF